MGRVDTVMQSTRITLGARGWGSEEGRVGDKGKCHVHIHTHMCEVVYSMYEKWNSLSVTCNREDIARKTQS